MQVGLTQLTNNKTEKNLHYYYERKTK